MIKEEFFMVFGIFNFGPTELLVVLFIVLIIFGPRKLPEIGRSFGEMLSNFRKSTKNDVPEGEEQQENKKEATK